MFILIFCIGLIVAPIYAIVKALSGKGGSAPAEMPAPQKKEPIDKHMDENYADVDWLRKGKL